MQPQPQLSTDVVAGPPVVPYMVRPYRSPPVDGFLSKQAKVLGVIQILVGILCVVFHSVAIAINEQFSFIGHGIWCGMLVRMVTFVNFHFLFLPEKVNLVPNIARL